MCRTVSADLFQTVPQTLACAVQSHIQGVDSLATFFSDLRWRLPVQIHALEQFGIGWWQVWQQAQHTLANVPLVLRSQVLGKFLAVSLQCLVAHRAATMQINQRVTQDAIEPGHHAFLLGRRMIGLHGFQQAFLHKVSCQLRVARALAHEANEGIELG